MIVNHTSVFLIYQCYSILHMYQYLIFFWSDVFKIISESLFLGHVLPDEFGFTRQTAMNIKSPHILPQSFKLLRIFRPIVNSCMCKVIFRIFQHICMNFISKGQRILYSPPCTVSVIQVRKLSQFCLACFCCCQIICIDGHSK